MATIEFLRADIANRQIRVDRDGLALRGVELACVGVFKTKIGRFNEASLATALRLIKANSSGVMSHFGHGSAVTGEPGSFLGRIRDPFLPINTSLRADLFFDPTAFSSPRGNLAGYVMDLANSDRDALSMSFVINVEKIIEKNSQGRPLIGPDGQALPPLWTPVEVLACDVVESGNAAGSILSPVGISDFYPPTFDFDKLTDDELRALWKRTKATAASAEENEMRRRWENTKRRAGLRT